MKPLMHKLGLYVLVNEVSDERSPVFEAQNDSLAVKTAEAVLSNNPTMIRAEWSLFWIGALSLEYSPPFLENSGSSQVRHVIMSAPVANKEEV